MPPSFSDIAIQHASRYPQSRRQDYFKLAYQHVYGPDHLIEDTSSAQSALLAEAAEIPRPVPGRPLYEPIGNGLCRLHLNAGGVSFSSLELYARMFVSTANLFVKHPKSDLFSSLETLQSLAHQGVLHIPYSDFCAALEDYLALGCPPVRHSDAYRAAYQPHYRVLRTAYLEYLPALKVVAAYEQGGILAIDGRCASGKTTLSALIAELFQCNIFPLDAYFLPPELRTPARLNTPGENVHHERFLSEVLLPLSRRQTIVSRPFDCRSGNILPPVQIPYRPLNIVEGSYSLHPALRPYYTGSIFLTCDPGVQHRRLSFRETSQSLALFQSRWIPLEEAYFSALNPQRFCNIVLDTSEFTADEE